MYYKKKSVLVVVVGVLPVVHHFLEVTSDPPPYPGTNPFNVITFTDDTGDSTNIKKSSFRAHLFGNLYDIQLFARLHRIYEDEQL